MKNADETNDWIMKMLSAETKTHRHQVKAHNGHAKTFMRPLHSLWSDPLNDVLAATLAALRPPQTSPDDKGRGTQPCHGFITERHM